MKTRVIVFVLVALLALGLSASTAAAEGQPWQAVVCAPGNPICGSCYFPWVVFSGETPTVVNFPGTVSFAYQPLTGLWKFTCSLDFDFDDPSMATIQEAGPIFESIFGDLVSANHNTLMAKGFACTHAGDLTAHNTLYVVNSSGRATGVCLFNPLRP
jgi:hypothetical protein